MEHRSLELGQFRSGRLTVNCSDPDPYGIRLLSRLLKLEERKEQRPQETPHEILLQYLSRLDETSHSNHDDMRTSTREAMQGAEKASIPTTARAKTENFSKSRYNLKSHRQYYNIPVKFYNPARENGSSSSVSFTDSIDTTPRLGVARLKDQRSPLSNPEAFNIDAHERSSQFQKAGSSKRVMDVHWDKNIESDIPRSPSRDIEDASEASPPSPFRMSDIQNREDEHDINMQIGIVFAANAVTKQVAKDEEDPVHHFPVLDHTSNASRERKVPLADFDVKQELISDKSLGKILKDLPSEVLEPIIRSDAAKESTNLDDAASINTRNDYWSISSIRSPPSNYEPNDTVDGVIIPPPLESPDDFVLPLDTLLKPIKKNTYGPVNQENVQKFLAGAQWHVGPPIDQNETLWMAKQHPSQPVEQPIGVFLASPTIAEPAVPRQRDRFLESIEASRRNRQQIDVTEPVRDGLRRSRLERYPGRETVYTEYMREDITEHSQQRVFIQKIRTQNTNPTDRYIRHLRQERADAATQESVLPTAEPATHKECVVCCDNRLLEEYPQALHMSGHEICKDCVARYLRIKILKEGMITIHCPAEDCVIVLDYDEIRKYCGVAVFAKYDELLCRKAYEEDPNFRWCTSPSCSAGLIIENGDASSHFTCLTCQFKSCFHCRTPAHPNLTCMQNWINVRNQFFAADEPSGVWLRSYTKPCYCGRWIQKMEGCDHVKCPVSPVGCGGEWCWMCGAKYEEIRRVGNTAHKSDCPHYA